MIICSIDNTDKSLLTTYGEMEGEAGDKIVSLYFVSRAQTEITRDYLTRGQQGGIF